MDNTLDKEIVNREHAGTPKKSGAVEQAWTQLEGPFDFDHQHESWWSVVRFWIQELSWRRAFWERMGRTPEQELEQ